MDEVVDRSNKVHTVWHLQSFPWDSTVSLGCVRESEVALTPSIFCTVSMGDAKVLRLSCKVALLSQET